MKKLIAVALLICLLLPCAIAEAPVDVKSLSDDELKALYINIIEEMTERKAWDGILIPAGVYESGVDLPEGKYECIALADGDIEAYSNYENYIEHSIVDQIFWGFVEEGNSFTMTIRGNVVYSLGCSVIARPFNSLSFGE